MEKNRPCSTALHHINVRCWQNKNCVPGAGRCPFHPGSFDPHTGVGFSKQMLATRSGLRCATCAARCPPTEFPTRCTLTSFLLLPSTTCSIKSIICSHHLHPYFFNQYCSPMDIEYMNPLRAPMQSKQQST